MAYVMKFKALGAKATYHGGTSWEGGVFFVDSKADAIEFDTKEDANRYMAVRFIDASKWVITRA